MNITRYDAARSALCEAHRVDEVKEIRDKAAALTEYARQANDNEMYRWATEIKLRAERKAGELLAAQVQHHGGRPAKRSSEKTVSKSLEELGVTKQQSSDWQKIAKIDEKEFEIAMASPVIMTTKQLAAGETQRESKHGIHYSSETPEHYTPKSILDAVVACMGDVDLDPCSNPGKPNVPARHHYRQADDGLARRWHGRVFMNPPYGREISFWVCKLRDDYVEERTVTQAIALVPSRTDTEWFRVLRDYPVCFISGRLTFVGNSDPAPFPSAVFYLGDGLDSFTSAFASLGDVWTRSR